MEELLILIKGLTFFEALKVTLLFYSVQFSAALVIIFGMVALAGLILGILWGISEILKTARRKNLWKK